jgi:methylmalonyl-CoA/ethylmalonyl-CoA epimerase
VILGIDHVGLATADPDTVVRSLSALGMQRSDGGTADDYGVACEFWVFPAAVGPALELVSPTRPDSAVGARLAGEGPGLYHVAFLVSDLATDTDRLRRDGFRLLDREPCAGARPGMRVAFMYVPRPAGLLVELVEYGSGEQGRT